MPVGRAVYVHVISTFFLPMVLRYSPLSQGGHVAPGDQKPHPHGVHCVVRQSSFGLPGQYGRRVTRVKC